MGISAPNFVQNQKLFERLNQTEELPSPPRVAARIIELGQNPTSDMADVAEAVSSDPALTAKLLRMANTPYYARQRKIDNLRAAITLFGLTETLTIALSFSLVSTLRVKTGEGMDHSLFWRRSLTAAIASRRIAAVLRIGDSDTLFLAGLLQDIGMLALDRMVPTFYSGLRSIQPNHEQLMQFEIQEFDDDHAAVGAWLLEYWRLPKALCSAVAGSHNPGKVSPDFREYAACAAGGGNLADVLWFTDHVMAVTRAAQLAAQNLGMTPEQLADVLEKVQPELRNIASLFDVDLKDAQQMDDLLAQGKETLSLCNLRLVQEADSLRATTRELESRTAGLEQQLRRDALTGVFNRAHLDLLLEKEFEVAKKHGWPVSVMFIDLDYLEAVNDCFGHRGGDQVLRTIGDSLGQTLRPSDVLARYGGERFMVVLPGTGREGAEVVGNRLVEIVKRKRHALDNADDFVVTASIGVATLDSLTDFDSVSALVAAADDAVTKAKESGRNRCVAFKGRS